MTKDQEKEAIELLREATETYPDIVYGREISISHTDIANWLYDWLPRIRNFLDDIDG